jgi:hypothetical protein
MNINELLRSKKCGSAVVLVAIVVVLLSIMGMGLLQIGLSSRLLAIQSTHKIKACSAADAGLTKAICEMNETLEAKAWSDSSLPKVADQSLPGCNATFSYKTTVASVQAAAGGKSLTVESIGKSGSATKSVHALVRLKGLFESAILAKERISLMPNTLVAGYNSADPTDADFKLQIGTTSTVANSIPLGPGTVVEGDVFAGVGGDPQTVIGAGGTITGQKYALDEEPDLPTISPPSLADYGTPLSATGQTITLDSSGSGTYTGIDLTQAGGIPGTLEIQGGNVVLYITGEIDLGKGCELIIRPGSSLVLYIEGDISIDNSVGINNEAGNVKDFQLYATGKGVQVFNLKAKSSIFGTVYAPHVDITLYPGAEMRGAIVGKNVTFKSGGTFYYDEALRDNVSVDDEGAHFVLKRWTEE